MDRALKARERDRRPRWSRAGTAAIDVAQSTLDLELRYRPPAEIDRARFELWTRQILVDGAAGDMGGVNGGRRHPGLGPGPVRAHDRGRDMTRIDAHLEVLREAVVDADRKAAVEEAPRLLKATRAAKQTT